MLYTFLFLLIPAFGDPHFLSPRPRQGVRLLDPEESLDFLGILCLSVCVYVCLSDFPNDIPYILNMSHISIFQPRPIRSTHINPYQPKSTKFLKNCHESSWIFTNRYQSSWIIPNCHELTWIVMSCHELSWIAMYCHSWIVITCHETSWTVMNCQELPWILVICNISICLNLWTII